MHRIIIKIEQLKEVKKKFESGNYILLYRPQAYDDRNAPVFEEVKYIKENEKGPSLYGTYFVIHNKHKGILDKFNENKSLLLHCEQLTINKVSFLDFITTYNESFEYKELSHD